MDYFQKFKFKKEYNSYNYNSCKITTLKLDLKFIKRKSYTQFQLNISKYIYVEEKCGKLCNSSILSSERGTKTDVKRRHSILTSNS